MTNPLSFQNEADLQRHCVKLLRDAGWLVKVLASDKRKRRGEMGLPDVIAFRRGVTLLLEFKAESGNLEHSQWAFKTQIKPHEGCSLRYIIVLHPLQLREWTS